MRQKTRILIYILVAVTFVILGSMAIITNHQSDKPASAQEHIDLGRIYLTELSYEKAVLEFTEAIEIEPLNGDAYLGLAESYVGMGDTAKAVEILEKGYEKTNDERLRDMLVMLKPQEETTSVTTSVTSVTKTEITTVEEIVEIGVKQVALGDEHKAVVTNDGALYMWGDNSFGQLGTKELETDANSSYTDTPVKIMDNVEYVSLCGWCSAAITTNGDLYTWGSGEQGVLGNGINEFRKSEPSVILNDVSFVKMGHLTAVAITNDQSLYAWGTNWDGQVGNGVEQDSYTPVKVMDNVIWADVSIHTTLAITSDNTLYMWGGNWYGQLGDGTNENNNRPVKVMENVAFAGSSGDYSAAITTDGTLYMWGAGYHGQLADGKNNSNSSDHNKNSPVKIMDDVSSVMLSESIVGAVKKDGSLYIWGWEQATNTMFDTPTKYMDNVKKIFCADWGYDYAVVTNDGALYTWGDNNGGKLGDGTTNNSNKPIRILENVIFVEIGSVESAALTEDGSVYFWGEYGVITDNQMHGQKEPVKIEIPN